MGILIITEQRQGGGGGGGVGGCKEAITIIFMWPNLLFYNVDYETFRVY